MEKNTVSLRSERKAGEPLRVAADAKLTLNGKAAKLGEFTANTRVHVTLSLDRTTVVALQAGRGISDRPERGDADKRPDAVGVLAEVDAAKNIIMVHVGDRGAPPREFTLAKDCKIVVRHGRDAKEAKLADLKPPLRVMLYLDAEQKTVTRLDAAVPMLRATRKSIDAEKRTITRAEGRGEQVLEVAKDAKIVIRGRDADLKDLTPGMAVQLLLSPDGRRVIGISGLDSRRDGDE